MPSILTHYYMAMHVKENLSSDALVSTIEKYPSEFIIGAQGPDIWLYHYAIPWKNSEICAISDELGELVHAERVNDFFADCLNTIRYTEDEEKTLAMISYVAGHLCHWALDSTAHPFVYYRTDGSTEETRYWHCRYEAMLDNYIMDFLRDEKREFQPIRKLLSHDDLCEEAIQEVYYSAFKNVWDVEIQDGFAHDALKDFKTILTWTNREGFLYRTLALVETMTHSDWKYTSHFITGKKDDTRDILNLTHQRWFHPCDASEVHNESFIELIEQAVVKGSRALDLFADALGKKEDEEFLLDFIGNRNYETGYDHKESMKYFNPIY